VVEELMCAVGIHGQQICVDRDEDLVVAWCSSSADAIDDQLYADQRAAARTVRAALRDGRGQDRPPGTDSGR
jgi:hypothetical protein